MHHRHQRAGDGRGLGVLDDVAIDDARRALLEQRLRASKNFSLGALLPPRTSTGIPPAVSMTL